MMAGVAFVLVWPWVVAGVLMLLVLGTRVRAALEPIGRSYGLLSRLVSRAVNGRDGA